MSETERHDIITDDIIKDAYSRLKAFVYYDNFNLPLRIKLAKFENEGVLSEKLSQLQEDLNKYLNGSKLSNRITQMITKMGCFAVPKAFENDSNSHKVSDVLISNTGASQQNDFVLYSSTILLDAQIEVHLIATLWIILEGVHLVRKIGNDSYGYHIQLKEESTEIAGKKRLFSKYFDKYQEWRDKGIRAAKRQIEDGNDVLLMSLDIKSFFHSVQVNFKELRRDLNCADHSLTSIIEKVCIKHTTHINSIAGIRHTVNKPLLPIGLVSSGVIANWVLNDFDKSIKARMAPVYYGRYVDDIFIVISNVKPNLNKPGLNKQEPDYSKIKEITEWMHDRFFHDEKPLKLEIRNNSKDDGSYEFALTAAMCEGLKIQSKKLKLFYFSPDWPLAMLNKFEKTLEENSSAFWFLPDEEKMEDSLDDKAYDMHYEDTINKFRSVSDVKASKYGASVFLAKRIKLSTLNLNSLDEKLTKEVFRFFNGVSTLSLYNLWEKVFTYLVVTKDIRSIRKLYKNIIQAIDRLSYNEENVTKVKEDLKNYLDACISLAFSHYPSLYDQASRSNKLLKEGTSAIKENIRALRKSLLTRHHYLPFPPLVLTRFYTELEVNLIGDADLLDLLFSDEDSLKLDENLKTETWRIPRWIHLQEVCLLQITAFIKEHSKDDATPLFHKFSRSDKLEERYTEDCIALFSQINDSDFSNLVKAERHKRYIDTNKSEKEFRIATDIINVKDDQASKDPDLTIGVSNVKIHFNEIKSAIEKKSVLSKNKRATHIKLLNEATTEKIDLLLLPETFVPLEWLFAYADESRRKQRGFIFGVEHFTVNNKCYNLSTTILPVKSGKIKESFIIPRLKNHYSPHEIDAIKTIGKVVPINRPNTYHLFKWRGIQFTLYNCYELTNVTHRSIFGSDLDMLFAVEYNKDVNYFSNIAESTCRDLHCYYIQANTSDYGDSRIVQPTETALMNPLRVKGGQNNVILKYKLDVNKLRQFQNKRMPYQKNDKSYKATPPDYDHEKVNKRGK